MNNHSCDLRTHYDLILVIDFGSQYTQLIVRRLRELGVYSEVYPSNHADSLVTELSPKGIILSGGPDSVHSVASLRIHQSILDSGVPLLGICYGMQALVAQNGGLVEYGEASEYGHTEVTLVADEPLFAGFETVQKTWMSHGDQVNQLPASWVVTATSANCTVAACRDQDRPWYGLQFHPEVTHTTNGTEILRRFALEVCHCRANWDTSQVLNDKIEHIRATVRDERVIVALSGGVDSSVTAALLNRALGTQVECVFVDTGLLRQGEVDQVCDSIASTNALNLNLSTVDASETFYQALEGVADPEKKRKLIGKLFIDVFEQEAKNHSNIKWLAQGTIYPDVIESADTEHGNSDVIKSHHNVGGLPARLELKILEPLRDLFKDEVRHLGLELGLPETIVRRHPFPGPGLAIRIPGAFRREYVEALRQADAIFLDELRTSGWYDRVAQAFAVFLPVQSVGVTGDARVYDYVCALRAVTTVDFMTAEWAELPYDLIGRVSSRIVNEVAGIARVVYDVTSKPPATIEWE